MAVCPGVFVATCSPRLLLAQVGANREFFKAACRARSGAAASVAVGMVQASRSSFGTAYERSVLIIEHLRLS